MDDSFSYEHVFVVFVAPPWYANIYNYLIERELPQHFTSKKKCALIRKKGPSLG